MKKKSKNNDFKLLSELPVIVSSMRLHDQFNHYASPKKKIFDLTQNQLIQMVRRGVYYNLQSARKENTSIEQIANALYYPSYISFEWALQYYGLISDRVQVVTSSTFLKNLSLSTANREFHYHHINKNKFSEGLVLQGDKNSFIIATPEKALADYVSIKAKNLVINKSQDILDFLIEDMRLDFDELIKTIDLKNIKHLVGCYHRNSKEHRILKLLIKYKEGKNESVS